jgi:hypothetical protein
MDREKEATTWVEEYLKLLGPDLNQRKLLKLLKRGDILRIEEH